MKKAELIILIAAALGGVAPATATQYSKLGIITAAKSLGKWQTMNQWIQGAGYWDEWLACQYFSDEYPGFDQITNAVVASGITTAEEIAAVLAASVDPSVPDSFLASRYRREMETEAGRIQWHGAITNSVPDVPHFTITDYHAEDGYTYVRHYTAEQYQSAMRGGRAGRIKWHGPLVNYSVDTNALTYTETYTDGWWWTDAWTIVTPEDTVEIANAKRLKAAELNSAGIPKRLAEARARRAAEARQSVTVVADTTAGGDTSYTSTTNRLTSL